MTDTGSEVTLGAAALWYGEHGFPIFPVRARGKDPAISGGFKSASTDEATIREWWRRWPDANLGLALGAAALLVVDIDPRNGGPMDRDEFAEAYGLVPDTAEAVTGGGGRHIYFRNPGGRVPRALGPGVDVKAEGGYVVLPPSIHESGRRYQFDGAEGARALLRVAEAPAWLRARLAAHNGDSRGESRGLAEVIPAGQRNNALASLAGSMRARGMSPGAIEAALVEENRTRCVPPLPEIEVRKIASSYARYPAGSPSVNVADSARSIDPDAASTPSEALVLLNALHFWQRRFRWASFRRRGKTISGITADGDEVRFDVDRILTFAHVQQKILASLGVVIPSPRRGKIGESWAPAAELIVRAANADAVDCGNAEDDLRSDLVRCFHAAGDPAIKREHLFDILRDLRQYKRIPHADAAPSAVFEVEHEVYCHLAVFREWLTTPSGGARYRTLPELREAAGLLGISPRTVDVERDGQRLQMTIWIGLAELLNED